VARGVLIYRALNDRPVLDVGGIVGGRGKQKFSEKNQCQC
jgi:hypothetical protein